MIYHKDQELLVCVTDDRGCGRNILMIYQGYLARTTYTEFDNIGT